MAIGPQPVEIHGLMFASTSDGRLLEGEVRRHLDAIMERMAGLERENGELRGRLEHVEVLQRLAEETVIKADEVAAELEAQARQRADELLLNCETDIVERQRAFDAELASQHAAAQARVAQLQTALEGSVQTLARALQAVGAPALEMPPASSAAWRPPPPGAIPSAAETAANGQVASAAPAEPTESPADVFGAQEEAPAAQEEVGFTRFDMAAVDAPEATALDVTPAPTDTPNLEDRSVPAAPQTAPTEATNQPSADEPMPEDSEQIPAVSAVAESEAPASAAEPELSEPGAGEAPEPVPAAADAAPVQPTAPDRADEPAQQVPVDSAPTASTGLSRSGPATIEIDMRPVKSFADLARVTKLLGRIAPGAQPVDLNLPQHRALFSVRGKDIQALAVQLQEALPEAKVVAREEGLDVLLEDGE